MNKNSLKVYTDGGARGNPGPAACAFVIIDNRRIVFRFSEYLGIKTNNQAEYQAVFKAFKWLLENKNNYQGRKIEFFLDSQLIVRQLSGVYKIKNSNLKRVAVSIMSMRKKLENIVGFTFLKREKNKLADKLVNQKIDEKVSDFTSV